MSCVGAVYSDRTSAEMVRELIEPAKLSIQNNSPVYRSITQDRTKQTTAAKTMLLPKVTWRKCMLYFFSTCASCGMELSFNVRMQDRIFLNLSSSPRKLALDDPPESYSVLHQPKVHFNVAMFQLEDMD
jgi:hypothetical protein